LSLKIANVPRRLALWFVAIVLMTAFVYWGRHDLDKVLQLKPLYVGLCFACTLGIAVVSALKWRAALRSIGEHEAAQFGSLLYYFMFGRAVGLVLPMDVSDFGVRTMSLKFNHSVSIGRASYSVYMDRTFDLVVAGLLLTPSILSIVGVIEPATGLILIAGLIAFGLISFSFWGYPTMVVIVFIYHQLFKAVCRLPWVRKRVDPDADGKLFDARDYGPVARWLYLLSVGKFFFTAMRFVAIGAAMGIGLGALDLVLFVPAAQFTALFALTPGGLGIADWSWSALLIKIGAEDNIVVPFLISLRVVISLSIIVIAGLSRLLYRKPVKPAYSEEPAQGGGDGGVGGEAG
jgi:uncharacterized membrane protein YbhN (UPF0104 family)